MFYTNILIYSIEYKQDYKTIHKSNVKELIVVQLLQFFIQNIKKPSRILTVRVKIDV